MMRSLGKIAVTVLIAALLTLPLAACGQKGPLYLPDKKKSKVPATQGQPDTPAPNGGVAPAPEPAPPPPAAPLA